MDDFSDDGFDDLNDGTLLELENQALQFTQAFTQAQPAAFTQDAQPPESSNYNLGGLDDEDLDDTVVIDEFAQLPARPPIEQALPTKARPSQDLATRSAYPGGTTSAVPSREAPSQRYRPRQPPPVPSQLTRTNPANNRYAAQPTQPPASAGQGDILHELQARVRELENDLYTAKGEASLLRNRYDEERKAHESDVAKLKKQNADDLAKQERLVDAAVAAKKSATTELEFTRQDLREELDRNKKPRKDTGPATPRKGPGGRTKNWDLADGFDDVELLPSPTKGQQRRAKDPTAVAGPVLERTPTKGKRKRPPIDSPVAQLEIQAESRAPDAAPADVPETRILDWKPQGLPFDFLQLALDHSTSRNRPLTFELFSRYIFPSDSSKSFASIIFQKLPELGNPEDPVQLLVDFCELLLDLWQRCLHEKYYEPVSELVALLSYILRLNTVGVAPRIVSSLVPIAQTSVYLVAVPTFNSADGDVSKDAGLEQLSLDLDSFGTLCIMYLTALGCASALPDEDAAGEAEETPQAKFWRLMQLEFVLMLLSPKQPSGDFLSILSLLRTSVLPQTIGPVTDDPEKDPSFVARVLIDRVSYQLTDPPKWAPAESYRRAEVRLAVLTTLFSIAGSPFGKLKLAGSEVAIPRLVTMLSGCVDALYDMQFPQDFFGKEPKPNESSKAPEMAPIPAVSDPNATQDADSMDIDKPDDAAAKAIGKEGRGEEEVEEGGHNEEEEWQDIVPLLLQLIKMTTQLLHTIITDPATSSAANMPARLTMYQGGFQRYLLTLARLSFAEEDQVYEAGFDSDTVDLAHQLLELAVNPDEAESIGEVFQLG
jgi:hypothetical protein